MATRDSRLIGGNYRLGSAMSTSGMLTTYTATHLQTLDMVGIFVITFPPSFHAQTVQHLLKPLERYTHMHADHVLQVHDWGVDGNRAYIVTNAPRGVPLRYVLDTENMSLLRSLTIARQITQGLIALHTQSITGLDLRPQLISIQSMQPHDYVQIDDIGLRPLLNALGTTTQDAQDIGYLDPAYAPPEYLQNGQIGAWSDTYQVGLLLFELVTGRVPFIGANVQETSHMQCTNAIPRLSLYSHNTPLALQKLLNRALAKAPQERFSHAQELLAALNTIQVPTPSRDTQAIHVSSPNTPEHRHKEDLALMATVLEQRNADERLRFIPNQDGIYAYLCYEKDGTTQKIPMTQANVIIGRKDPRRGKYLDIDLTDLDTAATVSRNHAAITFEEQRFYLADLNSRNKTRLNGQPLQVAQKVPLRHDDTISFGSVQVTFKLPKTHN